LYIFTDLQVHASAMLLLLITVNLKARRFGGLQCRNAHTKFREKLSNVFKVKTGRTNLQDPQGDPGAGILKESPRNVHRVAANEELDTVEGPTSSEAEKGAAHGAGTGDVEAPVSTTTDDEGHRN
jgi:hypothetical protein